MMYGAKILRILMIMTSFVALMINRILGHYVCRDVNPAHDQLHNDDVNDISLRMSIMMMLMMRRMI